MCIFASLVAQLVKNLPAVQETQVRSLGWEDPMEKEMATHSSILASEISWTEEPGGLQSMGVAKRHTTEQLHKNKRFKASAGLEEEPTRWQRGKV